MGRTGQYTVTVQRRDIVWYKGGLSNLACTTTQEVELTSACHTTLSMVAGVQENSLIYGTEYKVNNGPISSAVHDDNAPCAVCYVSTRETVLMLPARLECPSSWTLEYTGYLMSTHINTYHHRTMYECVDKNPNIIQGVQLILIVLCSTMLNLTVTVYPVDHMTHRKK